MTAHTVHDSHSFTALPTFTVNEMTAVRTEHTKHIVDQ